MPAADIRLAVGLGNPDDEYGNTAHNIGHWVLERLVFRRKMDWKSQRGYKIASSFSVPFFLVIVDSYMNVSGPGAAGALRERNISPREMIVVCDDFTLEWGRLRLRRSGSSGGHNGLKSVIETLGTEDFPRLRIGVGPVPERVDPADYVLKKQPPAKMKELAERAADALESVFSDGLEAAMNRFNPDL